MICKKCSAGDRDSGDGQHKCSIDHCKFKIPRDLSVCTMHSRKLGLCECCGKRIGSTRLKGGSELVEHERR